VSELKPFELAVAIGGEILILVALVGLFMRQHFRTCRFFTLYLLLVFLTDSAMLMDAVIWKADVFYRREFWVNKEILLNSFKFAVLLELAARVFGSFPGARATAQTLLLLLLSVTLVAVVATSGPMPFAFESQAGLIQPRIVTGTTWAFALVAALILWYRLPIEWMPKAILMGFVPYLILNYMILELRTANHWPQHGWMASLDTWAWQLVLGYWAFSAWQPYRETTPPIGRPRRPHLPAVQGSLG
jgi:hypothetical protein